MYGIGPLCETISSLNRIRQNKGLIENFLNSITG